jgi:hypothetical protein
MAGCAGVNEARRPCSPDLLRAASLLLRKQELLASSFDKLILRQAQDEMAPFKAGPHGELVEPGAVSFFSILPEASRSMSMIEEAGEEGRHQGRRYC